MFVFDATIIVGSALLEMKSSNRPHVRLLVSVLAKGPYGGGEGEVCGGVEAEDISCGILTGTLFMLD